MRWMPSGVFTRQSKPAPVGAVSKSPLTIVARRIADVARRITVFSTKYEPRYLLRLPGWERLQERFFGYHRDLPPELIARMLGARVVFEQHRGQQWVAVLQLDTVENARLRGLAPTDK